MPDLLGCLPAAVDSPPSNNFVGEKIGTLLSCVRFPISPRPEHGTARREMQGVPEESCSAGDEVGVDYVEYVQEGR